MDELYQLKKAALRRGLSHKTILSYSDCTRLFMLHLGKGSGCGKGLNCATRKDVLEYMDSLVERKACGNTLNVHLCALKFFFSEVLRRRLLVDFKYSKKPATLPVFLTKDEVLRLFAAVGNPTHKLILELIYSAGLRVGEVVKLHPCDFDFSRGIGWVRHGKGGKDRPFIIAQVLRPRLEAHARRACGTGAHAYLFAGRKNVNGDSHLSIRSVQEIVRSAAKRAGILKNIHPHSLRHSFATHLIENGYDVAAVQPLLGHSSAETTMSYVHMASPALLSVKSPYDELW